MINYKTQLEKLKKGCGDMRVQHLVIKEVEISIPMAHLEALHTMSVLNKEETNPKIRYSIRSIQQNI